MQLFQPPLAELDFYCRESEEGFEIVDTTGGGLTLELVVQILQAHWFECPNCPMLGDMKKLKEAQAEEEKNDRYYNGGWMLDTDPDLQRLPTDATEWKVLVYLKAAESVRPTHPAASAKSETRGSGCGSNEASGNG